MLQADDRYADNYHNQGQPMPNNGFPRNFNSPTSVPAYPNDNSHIPQRNAGGSNPIWQNHHVYGGGAALDFKIGERDKNGSKNYTINIDGAKENPSKKRSFLWDKKVSIMVTQNELPIVAAVFLGLLQKCEYSSHGKLKNKGFGVENQQGKIYFKVYQGGDNKMSVGVPITSSDAFYVSAMILGQLQKQTKMKTIDDVMQMLKAVVYRLDKANPKYRAQGR